jgi:lysophospholipid acyltransferase (LPLAT)-like uncharacterized protein
MNVSGTAKHFRLKDKLKVWLGGFLGAAVLRLLSASWYWTMDIAVVRSAILSGPFPRIFVFWHNSQLFLPGLFRQAGWGVTNRPIYVLISRHTDGRIIAQAIAYFGIKSVAGSSSRGGASAARALIKQIHRGADIAVTPDGPRGPAEEVKTGVVEIASRTGAFIYPMVLNAQKYWQLKSWDKMIIPKPFAKVTALVGAPFQVPADLSKEEISVQARKLEKTLKQLSQEVAN